MARSHPTDVPLRRVSEFRREGVSSSPLPPPLSASLPVTCHLPSLADLRDRVLASGITTQTPTLWLNFNGEKMHEWLPTHACRFCDRHTINWRVGLSTRLSSNNDTQCETSNSHENNEEAGSTRQPHVENNFHDATLHRKLLSAYFL